jgi:DNA-binding MarR family transcriptional regulator
VDRVAEGGLVVRDPHPEDRRVIIARLTPEGLRVWREVTPLFLARLEESFSALTLAQRQTLLETLEQLLPPERGGDKPCSATSGTAGASGK